MNNITIADLRIWHWKCVESHRKSQRGYEQMLQGDHPARFYHTRQRDNHERQANFHLKAVQALNDILDTTVFQDIENRKAVN